MSLCLRDEEANASRPSMAAESLTEYPSLGRLISKAARCPRCLPNRYLTTRVRSATRCSRQRSGAVPRPTSLGLNVTRMMIE